MQVDLRIRDSALGDVFRTYDGRRLRFSLSRFSESVA